MWLECIHIEIDMDIFLSSDSKTDSKTYKNRETMKKAMMMLVLLLAPFALQAQTQFHDVEANEAKGPVKSITTTVMMGQQQVTNFHQMGERKSEEPEHGHDGPGPRHFTHL